MSIVTIFSQSQRMLIPIFRASVSRAFPYCRFHVFSCWGLAGIIDLGAKKGGPTGSTCKFHPSSP